MGEGLRYCVPCGRRMDTAWNPIAAHSLSYSGSIGEQCYRCLTGEYWTETEYRLELQLPYQLEPIPPHRQRG